MAAVSVVAGCGGGDDYWDGNGREGAVYSFKGEVTEEAHREFADCGFEDDEAALARIDQGPTEVFDFIEYYHPPMAVGGGTPEQTGTLEVVALEAGIYEVTCQPAR